MTYEMNNQYFDKCKDVQFKYKSINIKIFFTVEYYTNTLFSTSFSGSWTTYYKIMLYVQGNIVQVV